MSKLALPRVIEIGQLYSITWRNGIEKKDGQLIEKRRLKKSSARLDSTATDDENLKQDDFEYYVHFPSFDRRLDEWVTIDRIDLYSTVNTDSDHSHLKNKKISQKRRYSSSGGGEDAGESVAHTSGDPKEKDSLLVSLEKEHEELTKVKNIQAIVLG